MRLVLGQTGAPTAVVNSSVAGFLDAAAGHEVLLARGGPDALVEGRLTPLGDVDVPDGAPAAGSWLGGGRRATTADDLARAARALVERGVEGVALVGGNGTMALLLALQQETARQGHALRVVGIPKTIDNDLLGVDHAPGFASAARFLSCVLPDIALGHAAMSSLEPVRVVETMGRGTGWLALAATMPAEHARPDTPAVQRVLLPENGFDADEFLRDVRALVREHGRALVVVSEGVAPELSRQPVHASNHTTLIAGGVARALASLVTSELGLASRGEVLGVVQRCSSWLASPVDVAEARAVGEESARRLTATAVDGRPPVPTMTGLRRLDGDAYRVDHPAVDLHEVAGVVREVPSRWRSPDPRELTTFHEWLRPLVRAGTTAVPAAQPALEAS